jgi:hypothetical protein
LSRQEILSQIGQALLSGDRGRARALYFDHVIPSADISDREADRLAFRVGAIDEGDSYLANLPN